MDIPVTKNSPWEYFNDFDVNDIKDPVWNEILVKHQPFLKQMSGELQQEVKKYNPYFDIYPPPHLVFNAIKLLPFDKVKCVLFGQGKLLPFILHLF